MGFLDGLGTIGLDNVELTDLYETKKEVKEIKKPEEVKVEADPEDVEADLIIDSKMECPVCYTKFTTKKMKAGKARLIGTDLDMCPKYEGIEPIKYDVPMCPSCGYAALNRYFNTLLDSQKKAIKETISPKFVAPILKNTKIYTYEYARERYKLALANSMVKKAKDSEKAYICLKVGWLMRSWVKILDVENPLIKEFAAEEDALLKNAYNGFISAVSKETFPMCGMDEQTVNYLIATLSYRFNNLDVASKMIGTILVSNGANPRLKDKARDLKELILEEKRKK